MSSQRRDGWGFMPGQLLSHGSRRHTGIHKMETQPLPSGSSQPGGRDTGDRSVTHRHAKAIVEMALSVVGPPGSSPPACSGKGGPREWDLACATE